jgi:hypothetical protein
VAAGGEVACSCQARQAWGEEAWGSQAGAGGAGRLVRRPSCPLLASLLRATRAGTSVPVSKRVGPMLQEARDASIGAPVRLRTKTGLPRHLTIMALPGFRLLMSISRLAIASTSADGFICARNLTATRRPIDAPIKRAPPDARGGGGEVG